MVLRVTNGLKVEFTKRVDRGEAHISQTQESLAERLPTESFSRKPSDEETSTLQ